MQERSIQVLPGFEPAMVCKSRCLGHKCNESGFVFKTRQSLGAKADFSIFSLIRLFLFLCLFFLNSPLRHFFCVGSCVPFAHF